jgi:type IV pilus assembly protein PilV
MTLLEVLVALTVVSIGLLGVAALNVKSLAANRTALQRARAVLLVADMADRIRANRLPDDAYDCGGICQPGSGGNPVAIHDIADWTAAVAAGMPAGQAEITRLLPVPGAPTAYVVRVSWDEAGAVDRHAFELVVRRGGAS